MSETTELQEQKVPLAQRRKLLHRFREQYGVTLVDFGQLCGISNPMLSQFENGGRDLSPEAWTRVLAAMTKLLAEAAVKRKAELAEARQTAVELGAFAGGLFGGAFADPQSPEGKEYLRGLEEAASWLAKAEGLTLSEYLRREVEAINPAAVREHKTQDEISKAINERVIESKKAALAYIRKSPETVLQEFRELFDWREEVIEWYARTKKEVEAEMAAKDARIAELEKLLAAKEQSK